MKKLCLYFFTLLLIVGCTAIVPPNLDIPKNQPKPMPIKQPIKVALVLGGGGAKGFAHAGVLTALEEAKIPINLIVGTSAGSIIGALYADKPNSQVIKNWLNKASPKDILGDLSLTSSGSGFIYGYNMQNFLLSHMQARWFHELKIPFIAVATDFKSGLAYPMSSGPIAPAVNASAAVPGIFKPVYLYGHTLVDGGLSSNIPVPIAKKYHPKLIIAVDVTEPLPKKLNQGIIDTVDRSYNITLRNLTREQLYQSQAIIIHPNTSDTPLFKGVNKEKLFKSGYEATQQKISLIKKRLTKLGI